MPTAVTPLAGDYNLVMGAGFAYGYERLSVPYEVLTRVWNNYTYFAWRKHVPDSEAAAADERYTAARRATIPTTAAYWERAVAELGEHLRLDRGPAGRDGRAADLAEAWDEVWERIARAWGIHFYAIRGPYQVMDDLADLYESVVSGAAPGRGARAHRRDRPRAPRGRARAGAPGDVGGRDGRGRAGGPPSPASPSRRSPRSTAPGRSSMPCAPSWPSMAISARCTTTSASRRGSRSRASC